MLAKILAMQLAMGLLLGTLLYLGIVSEAQQNKKTHTGEIR